MPDINNMILPGSDNAGAGEARILVIGVGGGGGNSVNRMIESGLDEVQYVVLNTDKQILSKSIAERRIQIGEKVTKGLGAGSNPEVGTQAAEESIEEIKSLFTDVDMVFITAGMGGGTGTGAAPIIAKAARENGVLTVGVVTKPFKFEGRRRRKFAEMGIEYLKNYVDSLVIVPNDKLLEVADKKTTALQAFRMADDVLRQSVKGITDLIFYPGEINLDFADIKAVLADGGIAHMGIGTGTGDSRVMDAVKTAIGSPLLETSIDGARSVIVNITAGEDIGMLEISEAIEIIETASDRNVNLIYGMAIREDMGDEISVTVVATGFEGESPKEVDEFPDNPPVQARVKPVSEHVESVPSGNVNAGAVSVVHTEEAKSGVAQVSGVSGGPAQNEAPDDNDVDILDVPDFLKNAASKLNS